MPIILAKANSRSIPRAKEKAVAAATVSFLRGAALLVNASDEYAECGADPAAICGFAESDYGASSEIGDVRGRAEFPPGRMVCLGAQDEVQWRGPYMGALPAAMGGQYGLTKDSDGIWKVDFNKTGASARVKVTQSLAVSPLNVPEVLFNVLPANVQVLI